PSTQTTTSGRSGQRYARPLTVTNLGVTALTLLSLRVYSNPNRPPGAFARGCRSRGNRARDRRRRLAERRFFRRWRDAGAKTAAPRPLGRAPFADRGAAR